VTGGIGLYCQDRLVIDLDEACESVSVDLVASQPVNIQAFDAQSQIVASVWLTCQVAEPQRRILNGHAMTRLVIMESNWETHLLRLCAYREPTPLPRLALSRSGLVSTLTWSPAVPGANYCVEFTNDLSDPCWRRLGCTRATGTSAVMTDTTSAPRRFYRVFESP
jgi:hypothetical protein